MFNKSSLLLRNKSLRLQVIIVLLLSFLIGWFLFTYRILDVPPGINGDEAAIGYNAALVARGGYDSSGKFLPLFTAAPGSQDWKQPVTFYSTVSAFLIFGTSYFVLRAVSVLFVLLSGSLIFLLIYELAGFKTAVWSLLIFATIPIVMIQSHLALENIAPVPFIAFWLWMIVKFEKEVKIRYLILAGVSLGLSVYSYLGLRLIVPPLVVATTIFVYYLSRKTSKVAIRRILIFLLAVIPFWAILLTVKNQYPGSFLGQYRPHKIASYQQLVLPYISSFDPSFLFIKGDTMPYHSTGKQGMFLLATLPLFLAGIVKILQKKEPIFIFILITFFIIPILYGLASDIHRGSRLLSLIPSYIIISSIGVISLVNFKDRLRRYILIFAIILMISFNFADFLRDYWFEYPNRVKSDFSRSFNLVFERAQQLAEQDNLIPFIQNDFRLQNPIAVDFFEQVYFPNQLQKWMVNQDLPNGSIVIVNPADVVLEIVNNVDKVKVEKTDFEILIKR